MQPVLRRHDQELETNRLLLCLGCGRAHPHDDGHLTCRSCGGTLLDSQAKPGPRLLAVATSFAREQRERWMHRRVVFATLVGLALGALLGLVLPSLGASAVLAPLLLGIAAGLATRLVCSLDGRRVGWRWRKLGALVIVLAGLLSVVALAAPQSSRDPVRMRLWTGDDHASSWPVVATLWQRSLHEASGALARCFDDGSEPAPLTLHIHLDAYGQVGPVVAEGQVTALHACLQEVIEARSPFVAPPDVRPATLHVRLAPRRDGDGRLQLELAAHIESAGSLP